MVGFPSISQHGVAEKCPTNIEKKRFADGWVVIWIFLKKRKDGNRNRWDYEVIMYCKQVCVPVCPWHCVCSIKGYFHTLRRIWKFILLIIFSRKCDNVGSFYSIFNIHTIQNIHSKNLVPKVTSPMGSYWFSFLLWSCLCPLLHHLLVTRLCSAVLC